MGEDNTEDIIPQKQENNRDGKGRFLPGTSGNPGGRPVGATDFKNRLINKVLESPILKDGSISDRDKMDFIYDKLLELAKDGNMFAIRELLDRLMGKAQQNIKGDFTGNLSLDIPQEIKDAILSAYERTARGAKPTNNG